jgi:hypothetical protein
LIHNKIKFVDPSALAFKGETKNPAPHQIKIFFANNNNITTNKGSIFSLLKIVISADQWYGKNNESMKSFSFSNPIPLHLFTVGLIPGFWNPMEKRCNGIFL